MGIIFSERRRKNKKILPLYKAKPSACLIGTRPPLASIDLEAVHIHILHITPTIKALSIELYYDDHQLMEGELARRAVIIAVVILLDIFDSHPVKESFSVKRRRKKKEDLTPI